MAACLLGGWLWGLFLLILIVVGVDELVKLLNAKNIYPAKELIYVFDLLLLSLAFFGCEEYFIHVLVFALMTTFIRFLFKGEKVSVSDIFSTFFAIGYTGLLPTFFILMRNEPSTQLGSLSGYLDTGAGFLLLTLMVIWTSDIGAYYIGKNLGKTPLCPLISPKKTLEGAIGGTVAGIIMSVLMGLLIQITLFHSIILGIIIVIMAQLGDLCESLIKRDVGVKDSGDIVPGHGGVLDRADSYIFTAPASYYYIHYILLSGLI